MNPASEHIIGRGWSFPPRINGRGGVALVGGADEIADAIRVILETAPGERVMRPEFGCAIWDHLFEGTEPNALGLMAQSVREALGRWEPRIELEDVAVRVHPRTPNLVEIELTYTVKAINDRRNLVHPFYVIPRDELGP